MSDTRIERDGLGEIAIPSDKLWGAQTQRSLKFFSIGRDLMPREMISAYAIVKRACAEANAQSGRLSHDRATLIVRICDELLAGKHKDMFPLHVWMTGSGTQFNMNINEVIANRASQLAGEPLGSKRPIHPNDHVNMSQSSNDNFPTAMHVAVALAMTENLLPAVKRLAEAIAAKAREWAKIVKIGRTHMQDAVPMTLGQEWMGYADMLLDNIPRLEEALAGLMPLALGGTAIGTGLNTDQAFASRACSAIAAQTGLSFTSAKNKFALQGAHDALIYASGALRTLAASLFKIANDIRLLACGPRAGFAELHLPENEPGSSIMPGKVNPTQAEALAMLAVQVMSNDVAVTMGGAGGMLEMNVYKPLMIQNLMQSLILLHDGCENFRRYLIEGTRPNHARLKRYVDESLMLVTALTPELGYDAASKIAHDAMQRDCTLKEAAVASGLISAERFDECVSPENMLAPNIHAE